MGELAEKWGRLRNRFIFRDMGFDYHSLNDSAAVAIFPELKLVYNRIRKAGNTTTTTFLSELAGARKGTSVESLRETMTTVLKPATCSWAQAQAMRGHTYITVVRNPHDRCLSAFLDKVASAKPDYKGTPGWGMNSREGFAAFVAFLKTEAGLGANRHWVPQTDILIMPAARFDQILHLETLAEDMAKLLTRIGRDPAAAKALERPHHLEAAKPGKITGATSKRDAYYDAELLADVQAIYRRDFEDLGYPG